MFTTSLFKCKVISPLRGGRLTSQPPNQPTGPPSPPACHSSWSNSTALSSGLVSDLINTLSQTHIRPLLPLINRFFFLKIQFNFAYHPQGRGWTSHCQSWRRVPAPCWQSHCRRGTWWPDHTGSPVKRANIQWNLPENSSRVHAVYSIFRFYLRQVVLPALAPVDHEVGQPLFPLIHFLLAKGLGQKKKE